MGCCLSFIRNPENTNTNENSDGNAMTGVAFDASLHPIPPSSIEKLSRDPTSSGGLADVWKCLWATKHLEVAVKGIRITDSRDEQAIQQTMNTLRCKVAVWVTLKDPHVLTLHGTVSGFGPLPALVFTWMENGELHGYLKRTELTVKRKLHLLEQVVDGLRYLHQMNVIHGDLTSNNVVIDSNGNALLADFGLSAALAEGDRSYGDSYLTGAVRWLAPELTDIDIDEYTRPSRVPRPTKQSDIFSLGCIMLEVFSGKLPFWWHKTAQQVFGSRRTHQEPYRLQPDVSIDQRHLAFMKRCWSVKPKNRPTIGHAASFVKSELARV